MLYRPMQSFCSSFLAGMWQRWIGPRRGLILALGLALMGGARAESDRGGHGWSQDLLARLLATPTGENATPTNAADGMVLRSYQLRSLRLGDPGRATNLVSILQRMLPPDSRVTEDRAANTLHVLSTVTAQQAALELVSAMDADAGVSVSKAEAPVIPEDVRKALESLAATRPDADQLMKIVSDSSRRTEERLTEVLRRSEEESRSNFRRVVWTGSVVVGGLVILVGVALVSATKRTRKKAEVRPSEELAMLPRQSMDAIIAASRDQQERTQELQKLMESFSIAYQADRQRNTMIMEAVAKKHGELAASLNQMEQLRRDMGENAGRAFLELNREAIDQIITQASAALQSRAEEVGLIAESASKKMEETANRLEVQNARATALADELERTQKEVDALFEKLRTAQEAAQQAQNEANEQRRIALEKTAELTKKEAALAGLSLLMQEPMNEILDTLNDAGPAASAAAPTVMPQQENVLPEPPSEIPDTLPALDSLSDAPPEPDLPPVDSSPSCQTTRYTYRIKPAA